MKLRNLATICGIAGTIGLTNCDENKNTIVAECDVNGMKFKATYHQIYNGLDFFTLDFYKDGKLGVTIIPEGSSKYSSNTRIFCDDGRVISMSDAKVPAGEIVITPEKLPEKYSK